VYNVQESPDYPLGKRQLTSTPIHPVRGNQSHSCLPHPAVSTITVSSENCFHSFIHSFIQAKLLLENKARVTSLFMRIEQLEMET